MQLDIDSTHVGTLADLGCFHCLAVTSEFFCDMLAQILQ